MADFKSRYLSSLEQGEGLIGGAKKAGSESISDMKKQFGAKNMKDQIVRKAFGGDDILSAFIRGKMNVEKEKKGKSPFKDRENDLGTESASLLTIIAKNTIVLPGMARDVKNLSQNIQQLVKLKGGKSTSGASDFFRNSTSDASDFFRKREEKSGNKKTPSEPSKAPSAAGGKKGAAPKSGIMKTLGNIAGSIGDTLTKVVKSLFNPKTIFKFLSKLALPLLIIGVLFSGIKSAFEKYQESGSFVEAIISYFGGALEFLTLGLFGDKELRNLLSSLGEFFKPVTDAISKIFESVKGFFKNIFGDLIKEEPKKEPKKEEPPKPSTPVPGAPPATQPPGTLTDGSGKTVTDGSGSAVQSGGIPLDQAQRNYELNKRLTGVASKALGVPLEMTGADTPTSTAKAENIPSVTPSELGKRYTGGQAKFSGELTGGIPKSSLKQYTSLGSFDTAEDELRQDIALNENVKSRISSPSPTPVSAPASAPTPMLPAPPTPATPPAPVEVAPTPSPEMSDADKIKQLEGYIEGNKRRFARREESASRHIASFKKRNPDDPSGVKELEDNYKKTLDVERKETEEANVGFQKQIDSIRKSSKGAVTASSGSPSSPSVGSAGGGSAAPASAVSSGGSGGGAGGGGGGGAGGSAGGVSVAPVGGAASGASISASSADVAEAQRMESAANQGTTVNASTKNNSSGSTGKPSKQTASAYDEGFAQRLATT